MVQEKVDRRVNLIDSVLLNLRLTRKVALEGVKFADFNQKFIKDDEADLREAVSEEAHFAVGHIQNLAHKTRHDVVFGGIYIH